jgi:hypothetical protein
VVDRRPGDKDTELLGKREAQQSGAMMITPSSTNEEVLTALTWFFQNHDGRHSPSMYSVLEKAACQMAYEDLDFDHDETFHLTFLVPLDHVDFAQGGVFAREIERAFRLLVPSAPPIEVRTHVGVLAPQELRTTGINNCFFKEEQTILHDELRFRSRGEVAIYDELKQRDVLFFPNPAAVLGTSGREYGEKVEKKEPDFLICYKGKWGILEINGDEFHSGVVKTAKDHERARRFNHYGLYFVQAFTLEQCKNDPSGVLDEFLRLLANHK